MSFSTLTCTHHELVRVVACVFCPVPPAACRPWQDILQPGHGVTALHHKGHHRRQPERYAAVDAQERQRPRGGDCGAAAGVCADCELCTAALGSASGGC